MLLDVVAESCVLQLTTGFNLADLYGTTGAPLKDMLQFKFETEFSWCASCASGLNFGAGPRTTFGLHWK
jgi:hypothetical protein